mmetsp:Transcript_21958/g.47922  ORF Transcript_21958/g.47922 Transcript_21958/m.47922 type:complete len:215 (+) Transcript_21958:182-826(+)
MYVVLHNDRHTQVHHGQHDAVAPARSVGHKAEPGLVVPCPLLVKGHALEPTAANQARKCLAGAAAVRGVLGPDAAQEEERVGPAACALPPAPPAVQLPRRPHQAACLGVILVTRGGHHHVTQGVEARTGVGAPRPRLAPQHHLEGGGQLGAGVPPRPQCTRALVPCQEQHVVATPRGVPVGPHGPHMVQNPHDMLTGVPDVGRPVHGQQRHIEE